MNKLWQRLAPDLKSLPASEQIGVLDQAKKGRFTTGETALLVAWMLVTFLIVQQVLKLSSHENKIALALMANLVITAPLMLFVFVPIYVRKVRRHVAALVAERRKAWGLR